MSDLRSKLLRPWVVMPVVAALAVGGWTVTHDDGATTATVTAGPTMTDQVVEVTSGSMAQTITAQGTVEAAQTDDLSFTAAGTVTSVNVKAGDAVTAGQVLATIDSAELEAAVADAESDLADAEATLSDDTDAGASDAQIDADETAVTTAEDKVATAKEDLAGASLVATFDGTVASVDLTVGEELSSGGTGGTTATGSGSGSGQSSGSLGSGSGSFAPQASGADTGTTSSSPQIQVTSTGRFSVSLSVDDSEITDLAVGQTATVTLSTTTSTTTNTGGFPGGGFPGGGFPGASQSAGRSTSSAGRSTSSDDGSADTPATTTPASSSAASTDQALVTDVGAVADASSGVASYPVTVIFDDDSGQFNVGATVSVAIDYAEVADAVQVPSRAVTTADGTSTVTVRTDGGDEDRTVTTGLTADGMVQITDGLEAGEQVVIAAPSFGGGQR